MTNAPRSWSVKAAVAALLLGTALVPAAATSAQADQSSADEVTVMTRNIYLGADIQRPVNAALAAQAKGGSQADILAALAVATYETRAIVDQTDFTVRSELLADEIADTQPDLIGLQEVALWRSGPYNPLAIANPSATTVDYDFLQILLDDLEDEGVDYEAVNVAERADVEAPSVNPATGASSNVRMTMHDVILMRADSGLDEVGEGQDTYDTNLQVNIAGIPLNFDRGYNYVDVRRDEVRLRFVNTHLEAFSSNIALAQATELVNEAAATSQTAVIACDCNSDPLNHSIKGPPVNDTVPHSAPYDFIVGEGFIDMWLTQWPAQRGWTAGLSERVNDTTTQRLDHRIDMIFVRPAEGETITTHHGEVTGDKKGDRDKETGLWPSDHAGVVITLEGFASH